MPPVPLDERIVVIQRPKSSPLRVGSPQTTSQQPHSASLRSDPPPLKPCPQPQIHQSHQHPSSSSSSSSSGHKRRSSHPRKSRGERPEQEYGNLSAQPSVGVVVLRPGQHKHTHTIDIKVSLTGRTREEGTVSRKQKEGSGGHGGSLKANKEKKVSLRLDLGHGERKGNTSGKAECPGQEGQSHPKNKRKAQYGTQHQDKFTLSSGEKHSFQLNFDQNQEQDHEDHSSFSSWVLREVLCAGNKENSKLGPIHQPSNPHFPPHQQNSIRLPHTSALNTNHPALTPLSSEKTAPFHHQLSQPHSPHNQDPQPHLHAIPSSCVSSRGGGFPSPDHTHALSLTHPSGCSCWRLVRPRPGYQGGGRLGTGGRGSGVMGLKTLGGCLSTSSTTNTSSSNSTVSDCRAGLLRPLGCVSCSSGRSSFESPAAFRKKLVGGCLPCAPLSSSAPLRVLQSCVGGCNPKASQTGSSTCSYCSSDPIVVTYNPHRGRLSGGVHVGGVFSADDDDYSVRTIWPEELAKKMTRSKDQQSCQAVSDRQGSGNMCGVQQQNGSSGARPVVLDCRNLLKFTRSQITDHAGRRCLQQGKMAVLDFMGSGSGRDIGRDSLQRLWTKEAESGRGFANDDTSPGSPVPCSPTTRSPASFSPPPSTHTTLTKPRDRETEHPPSSNTLPTTQPLHLVLNSLNREQDEENRKALQPDASLSLPLSAFLPSSLSAEEGEMTPDVENAPLSPILPFLFLGNERDAQDLELLLGLGVGFVVNVTTHLPLYHLDSGLIRYKRLPATDSSKQNLRQYFEEVFEFIEEAHQSGRGVLVHCQAGVSRSATIVIAYLMKHTLMTMTDAYKYVRSRRPVVSPNLNFMGQLLEFERDLNSGVTPRILTPKLSGLETQV